MKKKIEKTRKKTGLTKEVKKYGIDGVQAGTEKFKIAVDVKDTGHILSQYARIHAANQRQGTAVVKNRSAVAGSTRKIYRQKGTGRARHGARTAPIFVGGGVTHGPQMRDHSLRMNKKQKRLALYSALSDKFHSESVVVVAGLEAMEIRTKVFAQLHKTLGLTDKKNVLFVYKNGVEKNAARSARNISNVKLASVETLNAHQVMYADMMVVSMASKEFLESLETKLVST